MAVITRRSGFADSVPSNTRPGCFTAADLSPPLHCLADVMNVLVSHSFTELTSRLLMLNVMLVWSWWCIVTTTFLYLYTVFALLRHVPDLTPALTQLTPVLLIFLSPLYLSAPFRPSVCRSSVMICDVTHCVRLVSMQAAGRYTGVQQSPCSCTDRAKNILNFELN